LIRNSLRQSEPCCLRCYGLKGALRIETKTLPSHKSMDFKKTAHFWKETAG
jgi:hypothetical protein